MELEEETLGCNVPPGLPRPRQAVNGLICSPILGLVNDSCSLDGFLSKAYANGPHPLKEPKNSKSPVRAAWAPKQF